MKKLNNIILAGLLLFMVYSCNLTNERSTAELIQTLEPGEIPAGAIAYNINPEASEIKWTGSKVTGKHFGTINIEQGRLYIYEDLPVGGEVEIDMNNIVVLDLTDPGPNARLTNHLKSDDFFSVDTFPYSNFRFLSFEELPQMDDYGNNYKVTGNLTIKDITHTIAFNANITDHGDHIRALADFDLDRTLWNVRFRSGRFFENLGDNLIHDNFNLSFDVIAVN